MTHADRLTLRGMRFSGRHGALPGEQDAPQPFEVDLVLHADLSKAAERDDLQATVDYAGLFELTRGIVEDRSFALIEAMAGAVAAAALSATSPELVGAVEVRVRKPHAPLLGMLETVETTIVRRREDPRP